MFALAAAGGGVLWLSFPSVGLWPLAPLGAALLFAALLRSPDLPRTAAAAALAKVVCTAAMSFSYLWGVWPPVWVLYELNYGLLWAGFGAAFHLVRRWRGDAAALAAAPFLWVLFDWLTPRAHFFPSDIPSLGNAFGNSPLLALAPRLGLYGLTFLGAAAAALLNLLLLRKDPGRRRAALLPAGALALALPLSLGLPGGEPAGLSVAMARLREDPVEKTWADAEREPLRPERRAEFFRYAAGRLGGVLEALGPRRVDLILLPEDAIDLSFSADRSKEAFERWGLEDNGALVEAYRAFAREAKTAVAAGMTTLRAGKLRNTVVLIGPEGDLAGMSDKHHLTAGSERLPLQALGYWRLFPKGDDPRFVRVDEQYVPGEAPERALRLGGLRFGAPMCMEGHASRMALGWKRQGAAFLAFSANAQWFAGAPEAYNNQLLSLLRVQAAAYALPVFMTGKQSFFGWVDARGRASVLPGFGEASKTEVLVAETEVRPGLQTAASRWGEYFVPLSVFGLLGVFLLFRRSA
ncbi:MAG TPA: hypothetical protein DCM05_10255 [Elusimicrobia bacterium]|nr:hypothetical protein [Elusimicrobiota bacterium]